jgi:chromate transporter
MIYLKLFWAFFQVGLFSVGGGYAALPLIENQMVDIYGWLNIAEFSDIIAISQMTPGPIAINAATFAGMHTAGVWGAIVATLGCILPSCIIVFLLAVLYKKYRRLKYARGILNGLHPAVVGMIASAGSVLVMHALWNGNAVPGNVRDIDLIALALLAIGILFLRKTKMNPIFVMLGAGAAGGLIYSVF